MTSVCHVVRCTGLRGKYLNACCSCSFVWEMGNNNRFWGIWGIGLYTPTFLMKILKGVHIISIRNPAPRPIAL